MHAGHQKGRQEGHQEGREEGHERVLSPRELNRALLARQHLLARVPSPDRPDVPAELEHLLGLQSQAPDPPYVAL